MKESAVTAQEPGQTLAGLVKTTSVQLDRLESNMLICSGIRDVLERPIGAPPQCTLHCAGLSYAFAILQADVQGQLVAACNAELRRLEGLRDVALTKLREALGPAR